MGDHVHGTLRSWKIFRSVEPFHLTSTIIVAGRGRVESESARWKSDLALVETQALSYSCRRLWQS